MAALSIGNDICHIPRILKLISKSGLSGPKFLARILTKRELEQPRALASLGIVLNDLAAEGEEAKGTAQETKQYWGAAQFMAGRFAAKEAVIKAHPQYNLTYHQIEILRLGLPSSNPNTQKAEEDPRTSGPPVAVINRGEGFKEQYASISISHDHEYAMATCLGASLRNSPMLKGLARKQNTLDPKVRAKNENWKIAYLARKKLEVRRAE